jgi:DNA modification methylase
LDRDEGQKVERETHHRILFADSRSLEDIPAESADIVVTSPPYPMIEMWDGVFSTLNPAISEALASKEGVAAFSLMHKELDSVWQHCYRILRPGSIACVNIGDAVRTIGGTFRLYSNHARILSALEEVGFQILPDILWRKQTNAPNKFMGSGMLPAGAYVTYEHEYVLICRKGGKRRFTTADEKARRRASAFFWEERNVWFSDVWFDLKGASQSLGDPAVRARSGAYPYELAYRLICMYSLYGDTVFDPFLGTGTTIAASVGACRDSLGVEIDKNFGATIQHMARAAIREGYMRVKARLDAHRAFTESRIESGYRFKYENAEHSFPVMTRQETEMVLYAPECIEGLSSDRMDVSHRKIDEMSIYEGGQSSLFQEPAAPR